MIFNRFPELDANRQPVSLPDDGKPPEGRPIIIPGEDDLDPAGREQWNYEAAKRRVKQMPRTIMGYGLPNVICGLGLIKGGWDFGHSGIQGAESLSFALLMLGFVLLVPGLVTWGLALASRKRSRVAFRVLIVLYLLPFVAGPVAAVIGSRVVEGVRASGTAVFNDPRLYLIALLGSFSLSLPLTIWGVIYLVRASRALHAVEAYEAVHPHST
ncbi:MAG TPA: hypothetical protein VJN88_16330 [Ktedonobacterales bacterium]|nr:hypothetical protein [Ktedonobacterales bacterium]